MRKEIIVSGTGIEKAVENAKAALGAGPLDEIQYDIIDLGSKGFLGFLAKPTKIKAYIEIPDPTPVKHHKRDTAPMDEKTIMAAIEEDRKNKSESKKKKDKEAVIEADSDGDEEITLEPVEAKAGDDMSLDFVNTLISNLGINATAELFKCSNGSRRIIVSGPDASALIGHHGDTLDALQYLSNLACIKRNANGERDRSRVTLDIEGYRSKREETLRALARKMAAKALRNNKSVVLEPMNAYERRIIHSEIHKIDGVSTNSIGSDNNRKVVIYIHKDKETAGEESND